MVLGRLRATRPGPGAAAALGALLVYAYTLLPGLGWGDTAKFQFVGALLGTPHATGYPTYLVLNHLFVRLLPFGDLAWRANLLSAVFAAAAMAVFARLLVRLGVRPVLAALLALAAAFTPTLWSQAVIAEVYTLNALFFVSVVSALVRWRMTGVRRDYYLACALYAFSFGCHLTMITLLPAFAWWVWTTDRRVLTRPGPVLAVLGLIALGAAQYGYIFWRTHSPDARYIEMSAGTFHEFLWSVTGAQWRDLIFPFTFAQVITERVPMYLRLLGNELWPLLPLVPFGAVALARRRLLSLPLLGALGNAAYAMNYAIEDAFIYFIPGYLMVALIAAAGAEDLARRAGRHARLATAAAVLFPCALLGTNYGRTSLRGYHAPRELVDATLTAVGSDAVVLSPRYAVSEAFWFVLYGEGTGDRTRVTLYHDPSPEAVAAYLLRRVPLDVMVREHVPPGRRVWSLDAGQVQALSALGLFAVPRGPDLWEITRPPSDSQSPRVSTPRGG